MLLVQKGHPIRKTCAAELLWPESEPDLAMDCLYKACSALRRLGPLPLDIQRDTLRLDDGEMDSDAAAFERLYQEREDLACCRAAVELYTAPFLYYEYYEWTARAGSYYEMRYMELLALAAEKLEGTPEARYYKKLLEDFT